MRDGGPLKTILNTLFRLLCACSVLACIYGCEKSEFSPPPAAKQGVLDLSSWNFEKGGAVSLNGEWRFYWEKFLDPSASLPEPSTSSSAYISVPSSWDGVELGNTQSTGYGYATYCLQILLPENASQLALNIIDVGEAFDLYLNGKKIHSSGQIGKTAESSQPEFAQKVIELPAIANGKLDIVVHVSNFHYYTGGIWEPIKLGRLDDIQSSHALSLGYALFLAGGLGGIGLYHFGLFSQRRQDLSPLYFGFFCLAIVLRILATNERYLTELFPMISYSALIKTEYISFLIAIPAFAGFTFKLLPGTYPNWIPGLTIFSGVFFAAAVLVSPVELFSQFLPLFQLYMMMALSLGAYIFARAVVEHRQTARAFLLGFLILAITSLNGVFVALGFLSKPVFLVSAGMLCFMMIQAYALSQRFANSFAAVESMSLKLEEYSSTLETKVEERTYELAEANRELEKLARVDGLTQVANRRVFDESLLREWASHARRNASLSLILCDLDYFKQYNDTYGHLRGDEALQLIASAISSSLHRTVDLLARYGGEEFVVLLPDTDEEGARLVAEQIVLTVRALHIPHEGSPTGTELSISCGATTLQPNESARPSQLITQSDDALYKAKDAGRDRACEY